MSNPNFTPDYSTNWIYRNQDTNRCLTDDLDAMDSSIAALDSGKAPLNHEHTGYAFSDHTHSGYAASDHTHTEYATASHTHTGFATEDHTHTQYAPATHTHDYAPSDHTHTGFAAENHTHTGYAAASHTHDYAASSHSHAISGVTGLQDALDGKAPNSHTHSGYAASGHNHDTAYAAKTHTHDYAASGHNHDSAYAAKNHTHTGFASDSHTHTEYAPASHTHNYAAATHSHAISAVTGLQDALDGKAPSTHSHTGYAASGHNHDTAYAAKNHTHDYAASGHNHDNAYFSKSGGTISGDTNITGIVRVNGKQSIYDSGTMTVFGTNNQDTMIAGSQVYSRTAITVSSDKRLKRDIFRLDDAEAFINFIRGLKVVAYNYKDDADDENPRIGLIAQEVQKADKAISKFVLTEDKNGMLGLKPADMVFPLIAALQGAFDRIDTLERKVEELESKR